MAGHFTLDTILATSRFHNRCKKGATSPQPISVFPFPGHYQDDWGVTCIQMYCNSTGAWHRSNCMGPGTDVEHECPEDQRICGYRAQQVLILGVRT